MRQSAKLNLFLGVRNLSEEFLPPHLKYLQSFFRRRPMNALLPGRGDGARPGLALLVAVARWPTARSRPTRAAPAAGGARCWRWPIVEHWLLVLPLETTALWRWALRKRGLPEPPPTTPTEDALLHAR